MNLVAVDSGRAYTAVLATGKKPFEFISQIAPARKRNFRQDLSGDLEVRYGGKEWFVGQLAEREGDPERNMLPTKVHDQTLIQTLVGIFLADIPGEITVITGVPIDQYHPTEIQGLKRLLEGIHDISVNGRHKQIVISKVGVTIEGAASWYNHRRGGVVRIVDPGARTCNYATFRDGTFISKESGTVPLGWKILAESGQDEADPDVVAGQIITHIGERWLPSDAVEVIGGSAAKLPGPLQKRGFIRAYAVDEPEFANVRGYYEVGKGMIG